MEASAFIISPLIYYAFAFNLKPISIATEAAGYNIPLKSLWVSQLHYQTGGCSFVVSPRFVNKLMRAKDDTSEQRDDEGRKEGPET